MISNPCNNLSVFYAVSRIDLQYEQFVRIGMGFGMLYLCYSQVYLQKSSIEIIEKTFS